MSNLTQQQFSKKTGLAQGYIANLENGNREISNKVVNLICLTYNVNPDWLTEGIEPIFYDVYEGLDLPEVSLVAILDADKEGFLSRPDYPVAGRKSGETLLIII